MVEFFCQKMKRLIRFKLLNKKMFLKYAMPCLMEQLRQGKISLDEFLQLMKNFEKGLDLSEQQILELFNKAVSRIIALGIDKRKFRKGEVLIDSELIRDYFWFEHITVVLTKKNRLLKDYCLVLPGKIIQFNEKEKIALVKTPFGERKVKTVYLKERLDKNDFLVIHYNYACEKISEKEFKALEERLKEFKDYLD